MPEQTNPIKRLHDKLSIVIEHARTQATSTNTSAQEVWMRAFNLNHADFLENLHEMMLIIKSCEQSVHRENTVNQVFHLEQIEKVKVGLSFIGVSSGVWGQFQSTFNDDFMNVLLMMSENISIHGGEEVISEENLANLQADVEDIINMVVVSDLDAEFKQILLDGLESVRQAILNYRVTGAEGIRNAVDRNVGSYARYQDDFERASETEDMNIIHAYKSVINEVNAVVGTALKFKQLAEPTVQQVLPMLGAG